MKNELAENRLTECQLEWSDVDQRAEDRLSKTGKSYSRMGATLITEAITANATAELDVPLTNARTTSTSAARTKQKKNKRK